MRKKFTTVVPITVIVRFKINKNLLSKYKFSIRRLLAPCLLLNFRHHDKLLNLVNELHDAYHQFYLVPNQVQVEIK